MMHHCSSDNGLSLHLGVAMLSLRWRQWETATCRHADNAGYCTLQQPINTSHAACVQPKLAGTQLVCSDASMCSVRPWHESHYVCTLCSSTQQSYEELTAAFCCRQQFCVCTSHSGLTDLNLSFCKALSVCAGLLPKSQGCSLLVLPKLACRFLGDTGVLSELLLFACLTPPPLSEPLEWLDMLCP